MKEKKKTTNSDSKVIKSRIIRLVVFIVGLIAFVLGTIGTFLPILPTTPFYLLAAFCFVRSNERFNTWFLNTKLYKKHMENFVRTKSMIITNELILLLSVSALLMITMYFTGHVLAVCIILPLVIALKYFYFIFFVKPISREEYNALMKKKAIEDYYLAREKSKDKTKMRYTPKVEVSE